MRFDDDPPSELTAAERREFDDLARRLTERRRRATWRDPSTGWAWAVAALVALAALVVSLGRTPVLVPFGAFVFALVALHEALAHGRDRRIVARLLRAIGLADEP